MFFSKALVLSDVLLMAMTDVEARAIGKLSFMPRIPFTSTSTPSSSTPLNTLSPPPARETCGFAPHFPLRTIQSSFSIHESAWPLLRTLLTEHILPSTPSTSTSIITPLSSQAGYTPSSSTEIQQPLSITHSVQTLYFRTFTPDTTLDSLVLGLVFSTGDLSASDIELKRSLPPTATATEIESVRRACIEEAIRRVESERIIEGVLELDKRGGTVGFLIYSVD